MNDIFEKLLQQEDQFIPQKYTYYNYIEQPYIKPTQSQFQHLRYLSREIFLNCQEKSQYQFALNKQLQNQSLLSTRNIPINMIPDPFYALNPIMHQKFTKNPNSKQSLLLSVSSQHLSLNSRITSRLLSQQAINNRISQLSVLFFGDFKPSAVMAAEQSRKKRNQKTQIVSNQTIQSLNQDQIFSVLLDYFNQQFTQVGTSQLFTKVLHQMSSFYMQILQKLSIDEAILRQENNIEEAIFNKVHSRAFTETIKQPVTLKNVTMKSYQIECLNFLVSMYNSNVLQSQPAIGKYVQGVSLADDMGLGKTLQSIAFLIYLHEKRITSNPHLIIAPLAVSENWEKEFRRFSTNFNVAVYKGVDREKIKQDILNRSGYYNCIITTYDYVIQDKAFFKKFTFDCVIVDEASRIKNGKSKLIGVLRNDITCRFRLLLSGTPLQNNIRELFTLLQFIHGSVFDDFNKFDQVFGKIFSRSIQYFDDQEDEVDDLGDTDVNDGTDATEIIEPSISTTTQVQDQLNDNEKMFIIYRLHGIIKPYMIRRIKSDVLDQLPPKDEVILRVPLSGLQNYLYTLSITEAQRILSSNFYTESLASSAALPKKFIRNVDMYLRKVCNHPYLGLEGTQLDLLYGFLLKNAQTFENDNRLKNTTLYKKQQEITLNSQINTFSNSQQLPFLQQVFLGDALARYSGKLNLLNNLLIKFKKTNHRVLIFSQFKSVLNILADFLTYKNFNFLKFDGDVKDADRNKMVNDFNATDSKYFVFLLSTRAASHGLNLQSADTVIIFDCDFNAFYDLQAQDRVYRIGQLKPVKVIKLFSNTQLEQKILDIASSKLQMAQSILDAGELSQNKLISKKELLIEILNQQNSVKIQLLSNSEINEKISRNEQEIRIFNEVDEGIEVEFRDKYGDRPAVESDVPAVFIGGNVGDVVLGEFMKGGDSGSGGISDRNKETGNNKKEQLNKFEQQNKKITVVKNQGVNQQQSESKFINIYLNVRELDFQDDIMDFIDLLNLQQEQPLYKNVNLLKYAEFYPLLDNKFKQISYFQIFAGLNYTENVMQQFNKDIVFQMQKLNSQYQFQMASFKIQIENQVMQFYYNQNLIESYDNLQLLTNQLPSRLVVDFNAKILAIIHQLFSLSFSQVLIPRSNIQYRNSYPFWQLPNAKILPSYYKVIQKPISFKLIHFKTITLQYTSLYQIITDIRLLFKNCTTFNPKGSQMVNDARQFMENIQPIFSQYFNPALVQIVFDFCITFERSSSVSKTGYKLTEEMLKVGMDEDEQVDSFNIIDNGNQALLQFGSGIFGGTWFEQLSFLLKDETSKKMK
ncbi:SNF2 family helicase [Spironucleus salmonicida]|uniref:SNF-2 family ATP dependent chromatin remodeling factor n=1 Tax=Spironucleus salmonicida TaxID=348837 RepID=V6LSW4_9EUKA|nr:SNF2 family helicase [Spironucleus salmonicida]|eukprot:EST46786.1 SNF-2 family ATP dependent chromatin remodeling factor [Spironucleus salmonicida]